MQDKFASRMQVVKPSAIRELLKFADMPDVISFSGGFPDPELFPAEKLQAAFSRVLSQQGKQALQYTSTEGHPGLRAKLVERMQKTGVTCDMDQILLIHGAQQGLDFMAKMFINKGDVIVVERPTFLGALIAFNPYEPAYACVSMDEHGMDLVDLERILQTTPKVKFIYTVPEFQNPSGLTMPAERRKKMVELANQYDVMILEDSPYREIRYEGEVVAPVKSFDTQGRVVHLGSFSKILSPGLRQGWLVAEKELVTKFCQLKMAADTQNSTLNMYAIHAFLDMYNIEEHIALLRATYKKKKDLMIEVISETFPASIGYTDPQGGLFTWLTLPRGMDAGALMRERFLPEARVAYVPGKDFYALDPEENHCRLNYSYVSEEKIISGITKMGRIFHEILE